MCILCVLASQFKRGSLALLPGADAEQSLEQVRESLMSMTRAANDAIFYWTAQAQVMSSELSRLRSDLGSECMKVLTHVSSGR